MEVSIDTAFRPRALEAKARALSASAYVIAPCAIPNPLTISVRIGSGLRSASCLTCDDKCPESFLKAQHIVEELYKDNPMFKALIARVQRKRVERAKNAAKQ